MTITEQIDDFTAFAKRLAEQEGEEVTLEDALHMWQSRDEDAKAIQEAIDSYEAGERGRPVDDFLAERKAARAKKIS